MNTIDKFSQRIWKKEEKKFKKVRIKVPNKALGNVDSIRPRREKDFDKIPTMGGCYWIWTNEPVNHRFHKNRIPDKVVGGEIIYNGIAKDDVQNRVKRHLLGEPEAGWSGISLDIYPGKSRSHRKKVLSQTGKVPYVDCIIDDRGNRYKCTPIREKRLILKLYLSKKEKDFIKNSNYQTYYFRNGINVFDEKHKSFVFKVYFITGLEPLFLEYIEKKWREKFGLPKLCSYSSGR